MGLWEPLPPSETRRSLRSRAPYRPLSRAFCGWAAYRHCSHCERPAACSFSARVPLLPIGSPRAIGCTPRAASFAEAGARSAGRVWAGPERPTYKPADAPPGRPCSGPMPPQATAATAPVPGGLVHNANYPNHCGAWGGCSDALRRGGLDNSGVRYVNRRFPCLGLASWYVSVMAKKKLPAELLLNAERLRQGLPLVKKDGSKVPAAPPFKKK